MQALVLHRRGCAAAVRHRCNQAAHMYVAADDVPAMCCDDMSGRRPHGSAVFHKHLTAADGLLQQPVSGTQWCCSVKQLKHTLPCCCSTVSLAHNGEIHKMRTDTQGRHLGYKEFIPARPTWQTHFMLRPMRDVRPFSDFAWFKKAGTSLQCGLPRKCLESKHGNPSQAPQMCDACLKVVHRHCCRPCCLPGLQRHSHLLQLALQTSLATAGALQEQPRCLRIWALER